MSDIAWISLYFVGVFICLIVSTVMYKLDGDEDILLTGICVSFFFPILVPLILIVLIINFISQKIADEIEFRQSKKRL